MKKLMDCFEEYAIAVLICAMVLLEAANAMLHVLGSDALGLPQELAIYCYVWIAFLSASFCAKKGCDIAVTMISDRYGKAAQRPLHIVCNVINLALSICLLIGAVGFVANTAAAGTLAQLSQIPMVVVYVSAVVGYALCTLRNVQALVRSIQKVNV
jgi:TRAP-type C4-dicarboxylate transport system permease small subunit